MPYKFLIIILIYLIGATAAAESISVIIKPQTGLAGTTSLTIHDDGKVTVLVYESAVKINENTVNITHEEKEAMRLNIVSSIAEYLKQDSYDKLKQYTFTISLAHTVDGVTKSISGKRLNNETVKLIRQLINIIPGNSLHYVKEEI